MPSEFGYDQRLWSYGEFELITNMEFSDIELVKMSCGLQKTMKAQCDLDEIYIKIVSYQKANFGLKKFVKKSTSPEISHFGTEFSRWPFGL